MLQWEWLWTEAGSLVERTEKGQFNNYGYISRVVSMHMYMYMYMYTLNGQI